MTGKACKDCGRILPLGEFPQKAKGRYNRWDARCRECARKHERERYADLREYEPWMTRRRERLRAGYERRKREDPEKLRAEWTANNRRRAARRRERPVLLPVQPLADWLQDQLTELEADYPVSGAIHALASRLDLDHRRLYTLLRCEQQSVTLDTADRIMCRAGLHLSEIPEWAELLYPALAGAA